MQTPAVMGMMLVNRKTSYKDGMPLADYGPDENLNDNADIEWVNKNWVSSLFRMLSIQILHTVDESKGVREQGIDACKLTWSELIVEHMLFTNN